MKQSIRIFLILILALSFCAIAYSATLEYPYYMGVNEDKEIRLYEENLSGHNGIIFFNGTNYSMSHGEDSWYIIVTNNLSEDIDFTVMINSSEGIIFSDSGIMRWRIPYYTTIKIFKASNNKSYENDFQYIFLKPIVPTSPYRFNPNFMNPSSDNDLAFWGDYAGGEAVIKLYEPGKYSLNLEVTKTKSSIPWNQEFIYPQASTSQYYTHITDLDITNATNQNFIVKASIWDISKSRFIMELVTIGIILLIWVLIVVASCFTGNLAFIGVAFFGGMFIIIPIIRGILG